MLVSKMKNHLLGSTEIMHQCSFCDKAFPELLDLIDHIRIHKEG